MRVALFSPLPPARSGIADYTAALAAPLARLVELEVFDQERPFDPAAFDAQVYQVGNNPYHGFVYEAALRHSGVVVLHEANLHHLMVDLTIGRGDWDGYLRAAEYDGGPQALEYARRVRALETGPDYAGVPMLRRILGSARAVIVHSRHMQDEVRKAGFSGPVARIPHGAWVCEGDRMGYRERLGLDEATPLVGVFGFLKPYKRIAESLRAFRRLVRLEPRVKMILAGEPHPDFPVHSLIETLGLSGSVRVLGFTGIEDFTGYLSACDAVLNLRYPTVGETSGSLLRALGLGVPALISDIGAFRDFPDDICLKVPVDASEEDHIFEYLSLLVSRPDLAREMGCRARAWVERECGWKRVAGLYAEFLESLARPAEPESAPAEASAEQFQAVEPLPPPEEQRVAEPPPSAPEVNTIDTVNTVNPVNPAEVLRWKPDDPVYRDYLDTHIARLVRTLEIIPRGAPGDRILEMGAYLQVTPELGSLGYTEVRGCYYGRAGVVHHRKAIASDGHVFKCDIEHFDAEKDEFPYPDRYFSTVLCCELIEHLFEDPMFMMCEIHRILRPGGHLVLSTPNVVSLRGISAILEGYHPGFFPQYIRPGKDGEVDPRHNREYAPREIRDLLENCGFEVLRLETGPFQEEARPELAWIARLLEKYKLPAELRDDCIYAVGRKTGPVHERYPGWLYS
jgi:glycosyltransferase involved in cell wall biosynthesis/SAM-dependent methyltransferase